MGGVGLVRAGCGIPATSLRATTRRPGRRLSLIGDGRARMLRPGRRAVGLRQVAGMPHGPRSGSRSTGRLFVNCSSGRPRAARNAKNPR